MDVSDNWFCPGGYPVEVKALPVRTKPITRTAPVELSLSDKPWSVESIFLKPVFTGPLS